MQGSGQHRVLIFERLTIYDCFQKVNCEAIDKTKQRNVCEIEANLPNILVVLIALGIKTLLDCSLTTVPLGLLILVMVIVRMTNGEKDDDVNDDYIVHNYSNDD